MIFGTQVSMSSQRVGLNRVLVLRIALSSADAQILNRLQEQPRARDIAEPVRIRAITWSAEFFRSEAASDR